MIVTKIRVWSRRGAIGSGTESVDVL
jgi:hypothetical protein